VWRYSWSRSFLGLMRHHVVFSFTLILGTRELNARYLPLSAVSIQRALCRGATSEKTASDLGGVSLTEFRLCTERMPKERCNRIRSQFGK
jgi:hypothetical protein